MSPKLAIMKDGSLRACGLVIDEEMLSLKRGFNYLDDIRYLAGYCILVRPAGLAGQRAKLENSN